MKRISSFALILVLTVSLFGCSYSKDSGSDTAEFYYQRISYGYYTADGVIASESREVASHGNDLDYLLSLYLLGPLDGELKSPFPQNCKLIDVFYDGSTLCVILDESFATLENMERTIACACLAKTCFTLTNATQVQIQSDIPSKGRIEMIIGADSLLMEDITNLKTRTTTEDSQ